MRLIRGAAGAGKTRVVLAEFREALAVNRAGARLVDMSDSGSVVSETQRAERIAARTRGSRRLSPPQMKAAT